MRTFITIALIFSTSLMLAAPRSAQAQTTTERYVVVFKSTPDKRASIAKREAREFVSAEGQSKVVRDFSIAIDGFAAELTREAANQLRRDPNVIVELDRKVKWIPTPRSRTSPQSATSLWGLDRIDQRSLPLNNDYTTVGDGAGVNVYVLDTVVRATHVDFGGRASNDFTSIDWDGDGRTDNIDCPEIEGSGHGTHVAGTIAGATYGVAKKARIHGVRVLDCNGSAYLSEIIAGIDWVAINHVKPAVVNMSLGGPASQAIDTALNNATQLGVTFVVAAGNENQNACRVSPARAAKAITIGASTINDARASFSNIGTCVNLFAPGAGIVSAWNTGDDTSETLDGTSMATPHVVGAAAKYLQQNPNASPEEVKTWLLAVATPNKLRSIGSGSPNRLLFSPVGNAQPDTDGGLIPLGASVNGTISFEFDTDEFTFKGLGGQVVLVTMKKTSGDLDAIVEVYRPDGKLLGSNDDEKRGVKDSRLQTILPANGAYRVRAKAYKATTGGYALDVLDVQGADLDDFRFIEAGGTLTGTISLSTDKDAYYIDVTSPQTITIKMNRMSGSLDPFLELYAPSGSRVATNDDTARGDRNSTLVYAVKESGVYRIVAGSYRGRTRGEYTLSAVGQ
jgi:subtilisin family serine protease